MRRIDGTEVREQRPGVGAPPHSLRCTRFGVGMPLDTHFGEVRPAQDTHGSPHTHTHTWMTQRDRDPVQAKAGQALVVSRISYGMLHCRLQCGTRVRSDRSEHIRQARSGPASGAYCAPPPDTHIHVRNHPSHTHAHTRTHTHTSHAHVGPHSVACPSCLPNLFLVTRLPGGLPR